MQAVERVSSAPIGTDTAAYAAPVVETLSVLRSIKIGTFHIGSSLADILATGVWNRVMIKELGFAATPIALLLALRYFLAPLSIWVGQRSDVRPWRGYHRLPYIWGGRLAMVISYVLLGLSTLELAGNYDPAISKFSLGLIGGGFATNSGSFLGWAGVVISLVMFSVGYTFSGTTYLSLIHDRAPEKARTRAVSIAWFFLILGFAVSGVLFSRILPEYSRGAFLSLFLIAPLIMGFIWFFALVGEEKPVRYSPAKALAGEAKRSFWQDLKAVWASKQTRLFFLFLALTNLFFYTQDVVLEPFAGTVFGMPIATTSRFSSYWGSMTLIAILVSIMLGRRYPKRVNNISLSRWGVMVLVATFALFAVCAIFQVRALVTISLIVMGVGLGMWTVGSLGLMMDMTRVWGAGLYLSLWTMASTLARGSGVVIGGAMFDVALGLTGRNQALSYGVVFVFQVLGFAYTLWVLSRIDIAAFQQEAPKSETVFASAME